MSHRARFPAWGFAAALIGAAGVGAPDGAQDQTPDRPTFRTEANYVRVDVFPTRDGEPVTDLRPEEFEIYDEGVRQRIEQFEYVSVRGNVPQEARREPSTVAESREMLQDPRARVFVLFLDAPHVDPAASRTIQAPLVRMLDDLIGADDLVGVMTPEMSARDVTFARKTISIQEKLGQEWWGQRDRLASEDPVEQQYKLCYPGSSAGQFVSRLAQEMIDRRREKRTLDAFGDLVRFLRGLREERKAIVVVTEGWRLFQPDTALANDTGGRAPVIPGIGFDPRTGRLSTRDPESQLDPRSDCARDRLALALLDTETQFRRLLDEANRANASFYPVDPRGLAVFDSPIGPDRPPSPDEDRARLRDKQMSLRTLADLTDGLAVVNTNNISANLARVVSDLSSYYLIGYYASGVEMDGRFHDVRVRVTRPGVDVRARRGYLAPSAEEMATLSAAASAPAPSAAEAAEARALDAALGALARFSRELPLRLQVAAGWKPDGSAGFWVVGEVGAAAEWTGGGDVDVQLTTPAGNLLTSAQAIVEEGGRAFQVALTPGAAFEPGEYVVRVRARGTATGSLPTSDVVNVSLLAAPDAFGALFVRRGPTTGNRDVPTADLRFRRSERLRVETPLQASGRPAARLLGRNGEPLAIPVTAVVRVDADGTPWIVAQLALAPLSVGDYVIELSAGAAANRVWAGFRVVP